MAKRAQREVIPDHLRFGWEHNQLRARIREHLIRRGHDPKGFAFEFRVTRIQERIHKHKPTYRQRQEAARTRGEAWVASERPPLPSFDRDDLAFLVEHFEGANDPAAHAVLVKAKALLAR